MKAVKKGNSFKSSSMAKKESRTAYYKLLEEAKDGNVVCVRRGVYATMEQLADTMIDLDVVVPGGILCLFSAWNIHGLSTATPQAYHVAIKRGRRVQKPTYPPMEFHHISDEIYELGVEERIISGYKVKLYNKERSVCDAIKHRNKVGIEVCAEVVKSYLASPKRNLTRLRDYAAKLRVGNILERYLEIIL